MLPLLRQTQGRKRGTSLAELVANGVKKFAIGVHGSEDSETVGLQQVGGPYCLKWWERDWCGHRCRPVSNNAHPTAYMTLKMRLFSQCNTALHYLINGRNLLAVVRNSGTKQGKRRRGRQDGGSFKFFIRFKDNQTEFFQLLCTGQMRLDVIIRALLNFISSLNF